MVAYKKLKRAAPAQHRSKTDASTRNAVEIPPPTSCEIFEKKKKSTNTKNLPLLPRESDFPVLVHFSGRLRLCTQAQKEANLMCLEKETVKRLALPRSSLPAPRSVAQ